MQSRIDAGYCPANVPHNIRARKSADSEYGQQAVQEGVPHRFATDLAYSFSKREDVYFDQRGGAWSGPVLLSDVADDFAGKVPRKVP